MYHLVSYIIIITVIVISVLLFILFSNGEYADIHFYFGFYDVSVEAIVCEYRKCYQNRRIPDARVFIRTHRDFYNYRLRVNKKKCRNDNRN